MQGRFRITPVIGGQPYRLDVERTLQPNGMELFRVIGRNKTITIRTNRLILEQKGLKHRTGTWYRDSLIIPESPNGSWKQSLKH